MRTWFFAALFAAPTFLAACAGSGSGAPAIPAPPASWHLQAGAAADQQALQALNFYPSTLTIDAGDTVTWTFPSSGEVHTVTFLGPRSSPPPPTDPSVAVPAGGATYDGSAYTSSGFVLGGKTYSLTFTKPGVYKFYCLIHGEMTGAITVQPAGSLYPQSQSGVDAAIASHSQGDLAQAQLAVTQFPFAPGGIHLAAGISPGFAQGSSAASVFRFLDGPSLSDTNVTIAAGTSLTWTNLSSNELHTVTFGIAGRPFPKLDPFSPPQGGSVYDGSAVTNSGVLPPGVSYTLTFTKPGTYTYHCLLHDDTANMIATVTVQ